jgi:hypothetical protein
VPRGSATRILVRIAIVLAALAGFLYLFFRSAESVRSEPYVLERQHTAPWTLALDAVTLASAPMLVARPPQDFGGELFNQIFMRMMESLKGSVMAGVPLVLRGEYDLSLAGPYTPDALLEMARTAGLDRGAFTPVCVATRRVSEPGRTRQVYFVIFESPAFVDFRARIGRALDGVAATRFDAASLSPVLVLGGTEADFDRWLPIAASADRDCVAPIRIE